MADNMNTSRLEQLVIGLLEDIFYRLPATTLCRVRHVCRAFQACIDRHGFVTEHFTRHRAISWEEGTPVIVIQILDSNHRWFLRGWHHGISGGGEIIGPFVKGQFHFSGLFDLRVAGTADGLVVLQHIEYPLHSLNPWEVTRLTLWNPLLGKTFVIRQSPLQLKLQACLIWQEGCQAKVGFGRDPVSRDYKVVVVVVESGPVSSALRSWVEVYHVGANRWQSYDLGDHQNIIWGNQVHVHRTMHWKVELCHNNNGPIDRSCVMSFNPDTNSIRYIKLPMGFGELIRAPVSYNGSLAVFSFSYHDTRLHVLREDGNRVVEWHQNTGTVTPARFELLFQLKTEVPWISNAVFLPEQNSLLISRYGGGFVLFNFFNDNLQYYDGVATFLNTYKGSLLWKDSLRHD